jgi:formylglycine-generating enzyme required for sulfatase activity
MIRHALKAAIAALLCCACAAPAWSQHTPSQTFRDSLVDGGEGPEMVVVPAGSYDMGAPRGEGASWLPGVDQPPHRVQIAAPFAIGRFEVTRRDYALFMDTAGHSELADCPDPHDDRFPYEPLGSWSNPGFEQSDDHPVVCITRRDVAAYLDWLSFETGARYRLPTDAEWEYAARGGSQSAYVNGDALNEVCMAGNVWDRSAKDPPITSTTDCTDGFPRTSPVGSFQPNGFGLYDVAGNAAEMTEDCFFDTHDGAPADGSARTMPDCYEYVERGGSWDTEGEYARTAHRTTYVADRQDYRMGFRVVRELP